MPAFLLRRLLEALVVLLAVAAIAFVLFQFIGDPVAQMLPMDATPEDRARLAAALGLDQPGWMQFLKFLQNAVHGDFGLSLRQAAPVASLFADRLPATMELAFAALLIALVLGIPAGVWAAVHPKKWSSQLIMGASVLGMSLPTFLIGILLILLFSVEVDWLPSFGRGETVSLGWWTTGLLTADGLKHLILPAQRLRSFSSPS